MEFTRDEIIQWTEWIYPKACAERNYVNEILGYNDLTKPFWMPPDWIMLLEAYADSDVNKTTDAAVQKYIKDLRDYGYEVGEEKAFLHDAKPPKDVLRAKK